MVLKGLTRRSSRPSGLPASGQHVMVHLQASGRLNWCVGRHKMDERLIKQRAVARTLLTEAAALIESSPYLMNCFELIEQGKHDQALQVLSEAGERREVDAEYWRLLKKTAEVFGSSEQVKEFRRKFQIARAGAVQLAVQPDVPASGRNAG